jgi:hypothetical protein
MLYKATMSDIDTNLRPQAAVYIGQPVGDVTVSADQVPIYPLQFLPYTMCPVTPACPAYVAALNSCFKSFCKGMYHVPAGCMYRYVVLSLWRR